MADLSSSQRAHPRITVQYDAHGQLGAPFDEWLDFRFAYVDHADSQIDSIIWDIGWGSWAGYPSEVLPRFEHPGLKLWWHEGIDWVGELIAATRERDLECLWNHRVSEVDINPLPTLEPATELMMDRMNPVKAEHPDWVLPTWWWQGTWNYAVPEVREYNLAILRELALTYDLDGFQLDFARHIPCLPVGRQWELREGVTEFVRMVRGMLREAGQARGRAYLLGARIPQSPRGCRTDGLDVWTWTTEGLVDFLTLGSRSMDVDVAGFREIVGDAVRLQPCFDDHHATDGYRFGSIEFLRGVFDSWCQQGADSVVTFNWGNAPAQVAEDTLKRWGRGTFNEAPSSHGAAYLEVGDRATMAGKPRFYAVERRGGYPWAEGYLNRNDDTPLPAPLRHDGTPLQLPMRVSATPGEDEPVLLRAILFGARDGDEFVASLNGVGLEITVADFDWKDPQVFSPAPQRASGGAGRYEIDPDQKLLRLDFAVPHHLCHEGLNETAIGIARRIPYCCDEIVLEKLELHVR